MNKLKKNKRRLIVLIHDKNKQIIQLKVKADLINEDIISILE
jgi:hypothetical protein